MANGLDTLYNRELHTTILCSDVVNNMEQSDVLTIKDFIQIPLGELMKRRSVLNNMENVAQFLWSVRTEMHVRGYR